MKILVTGASGFLGTALCRELAAQGHELVQLNSRNCDLTRHDSLPAFGRVKYDQIYHLAAWTQAGDFCLRERHLSRPTAAGGATLAFMKDWHARDSSGVGSAGK